jgi:hypothetical protein
MRKNGHMDDCTFERGLGWQCAEGCPKAEEPKTGTSSSSEETEQAKPASGDDYQNHPKFAKFSKGEPDHA